MSLLFIIIFIVVSPAKKHRRLRIVGVIFSIKFIHLLIIAVNHSSCNEFYEFLLTHAESFFASFFCRCRPYSSLLSIIISPNRLSDYFLQHEFGTEEAATHSVSKVLAAGEDTTTEKLARAINSKNISFKILR